MGMYDMYGENGIQIKAGKCLLRSYSIGDKSDLVDGVYVAPDGVVVIVGGIFVAEFPHLMSKWGDVLNDMETIVGSKNPLVSTLKALQGEK